MGETRCKLCGDRGIIFRDDSAYPCQCMAKLASERKISESCIPPALIGCTFEAFDFSYYSNECCDEVKGISYLYSARIAFQASKDFVKKFLKNPNTQGLIYIGEVGSGKTFLACCIANALLQKGRVPFFVVVPDLLDQIRATYENSRQREPELTEKDLTDRAREAELLILDDLGAHNYTEWTKNKLYSIINYRLNYSLPVIITTNLNIGQLEETIGPRTTSRILQMCQPYRLLVEYDIRYVQRNKSGFG